MRLRVAVIVVVIAAVVGAATGAGAVLWAQGAELKGDGFLIGWSVTAQRKTVCYGPIVSTRDRTIACP